MRTQPVPLSEPAVHGTIVHGFYRAAVGMWGEIGRQQIAERLGPEARRALIDEIVMPLGWYPERIMMEWCDAAWEGPLARDTAALNVFTDRSIDEGWGRMQRALVAVMTPSVLARRAPELWSKEHSSGVLEAKLLDNEALVTLRDHPYVSTSLMRRINAESFRYIISLSRVGTVKESHGMNASGDPGDRTLIVRLKW